MIGRKDEMEQLEQLYISDRFEFLIMYGRRRVGKTTLLQEFSKKHETIFFSAQEKNDSLNLLDFSRLVQSFFDQSFIAPFQNWEAAFEYIGKKTKYEKTVLIIDEFPFLAEPYPTIKSILQHVIDHEWKEKNILLILCGSSVSFMLNDVMGYKSPLYGRMTEKLEVLSFDYRQSAEFFPGYDHIDQALAYGILGGVPRYLDAFNPEKSLQENIEREILRTGSFLHDEPATLLRMEVREPSVYNSILEAIAGGHNRIVTIADHIHEEKSKCSKYLITLQSMRLVEKIVPCGESLQSKKGIYRLTDHFYCFWYRFLFSNSSYYSMIGISDAASEILENINDYMGDVFEDICRQYMIRRAQKRQLPFIPFYIGRWWGNNPATRQQDDIDLLLLDRTRTKGIFCECKFRNREMPMEEYDDLLTASLAFPEVKEKHFVFFSKSGYTESVRRRAEEEGTELLMVEDLYV